MSVNIDDKISGCLFGGAVGDALGYPIEFTRLKQIKEQYGDKGIKDFSLHDGMAYISDDTQMTLFTAAGIINAMESKQMDAGILVFIWDAYKDWYHTQINNRFKYKCKTFLYERQELHARRAPGKTCLESLRISKYGGSMEEPFNASKGCGGVMRVAPVGLIYLGDDEFQNGLLGARSAALTHDHPLGYIPAFYLADLIHQIMKGTDDLEKLIFKSLEAVKTVFGENAYIEDFISIMEKSICYAKSNEPDTVSIERIGEGWTGDEALAIAIYVSLKYTKNFKEAVLCAANHDGDSDSTAAITGNILGAYLGIEKVRESFNIRMLDVYDVICEVSEDLERQSF